MASERRCCVPKCGQSRKDDEVVLHSFPNPKKNLNRYLEWAQAVGCDSLEPAYVYKNRRVCHDHFETKYLTWTRRLSPNAVPTLLLPRSVTARTEMMDITNTPSTSIGFDMTQAKTLDIPVRPSTSTGLIQKQQSLQSKIISEGNFKVFKPKIFYKEKKALLTAMKKLRMKKDRFAIRLKKALNLSENPTFLRSLKQFTTLAAIFTTMQFREIGKKKMGHRFTEPEKIMALSLYKRSPRTYRWLQKIFVLPSAMTLSRIIARANLRPGLNDNIFNQLKARASKMKESEKLCFLLFDEMSIAPNFFYNQKKDLILGFTDDGKTRKDKLADHVLVFMIRGVQQNYKQPVAYTFCGGSTSKFDLAIMIKEIIRKLYEVGLIVVGTICDQGAANTGAINILIQETRAEYLRKGNKEFKEDIFEVDGMEIVPVYDPPHLLKGIRNNLLQKILTCHIDGVIKVAKWEHIAKLYEEDPSYKGIRMVKKLTNTHINPNKFEKMKVKYATQVLSQKVGVTMGYLAGKKILPPECTETADDET